MAKGALYPVYVRIPLYADAGSANAKTGIASYLTPTGIEGGESGVFYYDNAVSPTTYYPAIAIWFIPSWGGSGYNIGWVNDTQNASPTQPKVTTTEARMTSPLTIELPRVSSDFTHDLSYKFGGATGTIASGVGTSYEWTPPLTLANQIPKATSGSLTITVVTKRGTTVIGTKTTTVSLRVPSSLGPTITGVTLSDYHTFISDQFTVWVANRSRPVVETDVAGAYGSTIEAISVAAMNATYSGDEVLLGTIRTTNPVPITITVTDSRGRKTSTTRTITAIEWEPPKIDSAYARRANSSGTVDPQGSYARIYFKYSISPVNDQNTHRWKIQRRSGSAWVDVQDGTGYTQNTSVFLSTIFSPDQSFDFRLLVWDYFQTSQVEFELPTTASVIDVKANKRGLAIGKASERDVFEVGWPSHFTGGVWRGERFCYYQPATNCNNITDEWVLGSNGSNYPGSDFWYVNTIQYLEAGQRKQIAYGYRTNEIYVRYLYGGTWWAWTKVSPVSWGDISGRPSTFPPSSHSHDEFKRVLKIDLAGGADNAIPLVDGEVIDLVATTNQNAGAVHVVARRNGSTVYHTVLTISTSFTISVSGTNLIVKPTYAARGILTSTRY